MPCWSFLFFSFFLKQLGFNTTVAMKTKLCVDKSQTDKNYNHFTQHFQGKPQKKTLLCLCVFWHDNSVKRLWKYKSWEIAPKVKLYQIVPSLSSLKLWKMKTWWDAVIHAHHISHWEIVLHKLSRWTIRTIFPSMCHVLVHILLELGGFLIDAHLFSWLTPFNCTCLYTVEQPWVCKSWK